MRRIIIPISQYDIEFFTDLLNGKTDNIGWEFPDEESGEPIIVEFIREEIEEEKEEEEY